jgi:phage gp37-like protein
MTLGQLTDAIAANLALRLGDAVAECSSHGGRFDPGEISRTAVNAPAVKVSLFEVQEFTPAGRSEWRAVVAFGVWIIARDVGTKPRDEVAADIASVVLQRIAAADWGDKAHFKNVAPKTARAMNLYSGVVDQQAVALWAVQWQQECLIEREPEPSPT